MAKEFMQSAYLTGEDSELPMADMGFSKINYGEQRMGVGVGSEGSLEYVDPGSEGAVAVKLQIGNGGIGSQEKGPAMAD